MLRKQNSYEWKYVEFGTIKLVPCQPLACRKVLTEGNPVSPQIFIRYPIKSLNIMCIVNNLPNHTALQQL